jgi:hypothetical protein
MLGLVAVIELAVIVYLIWANRCDQRHFTDVLVAETAPKTKYAQAMNARQTVTQSGEEISIEETDVDEDGDYPSA